MGVAVFCDLEESVKELKRFVVDMSQFCSQMLLREMESGCRPDVGGVGPDVTRRGKCRDRA